MILKTKAILAIVVSMAPATLVAIEMGPWHSMPLAMLGGFIGPIWAVIILNKGANGE